MRTIWKIPLAITDAQSIVLPVGYEILTVQLQNGQPCLWVAVYPDNIDDQVEIYTVGTGNPCCLHTYINTYQLNGFVWHTFYA